MGEHGLVIDDSNLALAQGDVRAAAQERGQRDQVVLARGLQLFKRR